MRGLAYMISGFEREVVAWQFATDGDDDFYDALARAFQRKKLGASFLCSAGKLIGVPVRLGTEFACK